MKKHHIILACKDRTLADGIRLAIEAWAGVGIIEIAITADELLKIPLGKTDQLIVLDEHLHGITSRDVWFNLITECLPSKVLVLTRTIDPIFLKKTMSMVACVPGGNGLDEIKEGISRCIRTGGYSSLYLTKIISKATIVVAADALLTPDLTEILHHWVKGYKVKESAAMRNTAEGTIKNQRSTIRKLITQHGFPTPRDYARHIGLIND